MQILNARMAQYFKPKAAPRSDPYRKSRPLAKQLAAALGVEIEAMRPGFNVWPPRGMLDSADEFNGDHFANDWDEVLERVQAYAAALQAPPTEVLGSSQEK